MWILWISQNYGYWELGTGTGTGRGGPEQLDIWYWPEVWGPTTPTILSPQFHRSLELLHGVGANPTFRLKNPFNNGSAFSAALIGLSQESTAKNKNNKWGNTISTGDEIYTPMFSFSSKRVVYILILEQDWYEMKCKIRNFLNSY